MANKTHQSIKHLGLRSSVLVVASSFLLAGAPQPAEAAGLGRLVVFSALGQPLRAEIEVTATRQELADMRIQLASQDVFRQAGLDYATTLLGVRFDLEVRENGKAVIKVASDKPINDPFLDMLLELNWSTGRLVREYTFLLDPPEYMARVPAEAAPIVGAPVAAGPMPAAPATAGPGGSVSAIDEGIRARALAQVQGQRMPPPRQGAGAQGQPGPAERLPAYRTGEGREVKRGETLAGIARQMMSEGVSLDQMLVALFRANPNAFDGKNMNRLRTGAILTAPRESDLSSVSRGEARKIVVAQSADWNAYRSKLAGVAVGSPAGDSAARQESSGKITPRVDDKAEQAGPRDRVRISRTDARSGSGGAVARASNEDLIAANKALGEAQARVRELERNVTDLNNLVNMQNQKLAELEKRLSAPASKPPEPASKPPEPASKPPEPASKPPEPVSKPPEPAPRPRRAPPPPPPPPEPSFLDELMGNWTLLAAGGGGIVAILAGFLFWRRRRAMAQEEELNTLTPPSTTGGTTGLMDSSSAFRQTGEQSIDTTSSQLAQTDFSQAGPGSIDTDEVDPVAEADVYMAYGRDAQAEEILLDARQKDPGRVAIVVKLLEIYSGRKDTKQFEALATDLYSQTGGTGADWNKAAAMGRVLDPNNPVYRGIGSAAPADSAPAAPAAPAAAPSPSSPPPAQLAGAPAVSQVRPVAARPSPEVKADLPSLDFDIGTRIAPLSEALAQDSKAPQPAGLDFDLGGDTLIPVDQGKAAQSAGPGAETSSVEQVAPGDDGVEFDVSLTESTFLGRLPRERPVDMASIDLDLQSPELDITLESQPPSTKAVKEDASRGVQVSTAINPAFATEQMETMLTPAADFSAQSETAVNADFATEQMETQVVSGVPDSQAETAFNYDLASQQAETVVSPAGQETTASEDVATKLDLARAYEEMGDAEGARELLQEVLKEGNASQRETAQGMLAKLGG
ncbi:MAG: hypothetical protein LBE85_00420 [Candidatus Accumulibacter sp.]|nr:hypothetical protein [Accumulibacter sp.]